MHQIYFINNDTELASGVLPIVYVKSCHFCVKSSKSYMLSDYKIESKGLTFIEFHPKAPGWIQEYID